MTLLKKIAFSLGILLTPLTLFAHDEGHGPKLTDVGIYGGIVSPVIASKDADKGAHAALLYKAELVRGEDGTIRLYLYDTKMKPLPMESFEKKAKGTFYISKGNSKEFSLQQEGKGFIGKTSLPTKKPYDLDVVLKDKDRELLTAFGNLD